MKISADLHIHSRFSLATSRELRPETLDLWARYKGLQVVASGDFTHPAWLKELEDKLQPAEDGLFQLRDDLRIRPPRIHPGCLDAPVRFILSAEINTIYRKHNRTRKVHHLILAPDFAGVRRIQDRLLRLGANLTSDGRPILGLDSRQLLEICLEACPEVTFIPAHIWTPWFSVLGEKSGFDSIEECYEDLSGDIFAVETGLSSDPPMNRLCSRLDRYTLVSNSDAHSPEKLGRECNLFDIDLSYTALRDALKSGDPSRFLGTVEFFPQEGKYHIDGHRKCGIRWHPQQTIDHDGRCPVCGKAVTVGVLHRVMQLADRDSDEPPPLRHPFHSLIQLKAMLAELEGTGPGSKTVATKYLDVLQALGPELPLLLETADRDIAAQGFPELAAAISRMRAGRVHIEEGFDGEYGRILVYHPGEGKETGQSPLLDLPPVSPPPLKKGSERPKRQGFKATTPAKKKTEPPPTKAAVELNPEQESAVRHGVRPLLVLAGPGTGKTALIAARIHRLIEAERVDPQTILAISFTNKAAGELRQRLAKTLTAPAAEAVRVATFHSFGYEILKEHANACGRTVPFRILDEEERNGLITEATDGYDGHRTDFPETISRAKNRLEEPDPIADPETWAAFSRYENRLREENAFDLDDLIRIPARLLEENAAVRDAFRRHCQWILIDEYQDINLAQFRLIKSLADPAAPKLTAVGDPNQSIYGFRGAEIGFIYRFPDDFPETTVVRLSRSYRCPGTVLDASGQVVGGHEWTALHGSDQGVKLRIVHHPTDRGEAEFIARTIEEMIGGVRFFSLDSRISQGDSVEGITSLADFAILCRTSRQIPVLEKALADHGLPCQRIGAIPFFREEPFRSLISLFAGRSGTGTRQATIAALWKQEEIDHFLNRTPPGSTIAQFMSAAASRFCSAELRAEPERFHRFIQFTDEFGCDADRFFFHVRSGSPVDGLRPLEQVNLMTIHAAKGLEFPCVFIAGCEAGLLPYSLFGQPADPEEERRLLYVGMTRSSRYLFLTHADRRMLFGRLWESPRSPFLDRIEKDLLEAEKRENPRKRSQTEDRQPSLFADLVDPDPPGKRRKKRP